MTSTLCTTTSAFQGLPPIGPLRRLAEPSVSHGRTTSKRKSEESLERAGKSSRTRSPDCSRTSSGCLVIDTDARSSGGCGHTSSGCIVIHSHASSSSSSVCIVSSDRPESETPVSVSSRAEENSPKRKSEETEEPRKRSRKTSSSHTPGTSSATDSLAPHSRDAFNDRYDEQELLGEGGFGRVFGGRRRDDHLPVAIKHVSKEQRIKETSMSLDGEIRTVPLEVALMLRLQPAAGETSAAVALLDWYDLDLELVLVLERPVPCMDLLDYRDSLGHHLPEDQAKTIIRQLLDAVLEVHSKGVFHKDIKLDNVLIETGSGVPRVRLIDFGCGTFLSEGLYTTRLGTFVYSCPEWFLFRGYRADPSTAWQLGVVLFTLLQGQVPFRDQDQISFQEPHVRGDFSSECKAFLLSCLEKSPEDRPPLEELKHHPWLSTH